ncbi:MAG: hypothetical protein ACLFVC_08910 [Opitutales bacterium]
MRFLICCLLASLITGCASTRPPAVDSVEIKEIKPRYIEEAAFKRIGEYLTGKENTGNRVILRSVEEARTGYYFTLVLDENVRRLPRGTVVVGEFHTPKSLDVQEHRFEIPSGKLPKTKEIFVGLTGEDWTFGPDAVPAAWRFTIEDANGEALATEKSYLWSL